MEIIAPALNAAFVLVMTVVLTWYIRDVFSEEKQDADRRFLEFKQYVDQRFSEVDGRFAEVDRRFGEVDRRLGDLRSDMNAIQAQLVAIALAVGAQPRPNTA